MPQLPYADPQFASDPQAVPPGPWRKPAMGHGPPMPLQAASYPQRPLPQQQTDYFRAQLRDKGEAGPPMPGDDQPGGRQPPLPPQALGTAAPAGAEFAGAAKPPPMPGPASPFPQPPAASVPPVDMRQLTGQMQTAMSAVPKFMSYEATPYASINPYSDISPALQERMEQMRLASSQPSNLPQATMAANAQAQQSGLHALGQAQATQAGLQGAAWQAQAEALRAQSQLEGERIRAMMEHDKMAQAVVLDPNLTPEQKSNTLDALDKMRQSRAASLGSMPGQWQGGGQNPPMPGQQPAPAKTPSDALKESIEKLTVGTDPKEIDAALVESGLKSTQAETLPSINAESIVTALRSHPNLLEPGRMALFLREARKQGIDVTELGKEVERAMVRRYTQTMGLGGTGLGSGILGGGINSGPARYGNVTVSPLPSSSPGAPDYRVEGPGFSSLHPGNRGWRNLWGTWNPYTDAVPTVQKESRDRMVRENETVLAPLLEALRRGP